MRCNAMHQTSHITSLACCGGWIAAVIITFTNFALVSWSSSFAAFVFPKDKRKRMMMMARAISSYDKVAVCFVGNISRGLRMQCSISGFLLPISISNPEFWKLLKSYVISASFRVSTANQPDQTCLQIIGSFGNFHKYRDCFSWLLPQHLWT